MIDADLLNQAVRVTVAVATQKIVLIIKLNIILLAAVLAGQRLCIITHDEYHTHLPDSTCQSNVQ